MIKKLLLLSSLICVLMWVGVSLNRSKQPTLNRSKEFYYQLVDQPLNLNGETLLLGIVPHHLVAKRWISEFWATVAVSKPKRIFLISPNHFDANTNKITTNTATLHVFKGLPFIKASDEVIVNDHGITTHLPFINYFTPNSVVIPLIMSNTTTREELNQLTSYITTLFNEKEDVIIASLDFSHYLDQKLANQKDVETLRLIETRDYDPIFGLTNDHVDGRSGLVFYLMLANKWGCQNPTIFHHGNSGQFSPKTSNNSTSYVVAGIPVSHCKQLTNP